MEELKLKTNKENEAVNEGEYIQLSFEDIFFGDNSNKERKD